MKKQMTDALHYRRHSTADVLELAHLHGLIGYAQGRKPAASPLLQKVLSEGLGATLGKTYALALKMAGEGY